MTATRTTHTKLTFYQAEGGRGGNTQERDPGKVAEAANRAQKGVCVCVGGGGGAAVGDVRIPGATRTPPPAVADPCEDTPSSRKRGPRGRRAHRCVSRRRVAVREASGCQSFPNFPKLPLPFGHRLPTAHTLPSLRPRPPPQRLLLRKRLPERRGGPLGTGLPTYPPPPTPQDPAAAREGTEAGAAATGAFPRPDAASPARRLSAGPGHSAAPARPGPLRACGRRAAPRSPGGGTRLGRRGESCGERFAGM